MIHAIYLSIIAVLLGFVYLLRRYAIHKGKMAQQFADQVARLHRVHKLALTLSDSDIDDIVNGRRHIHKNPPKRKAAQGLMPIDYTSASPDNNAITAQMKQRNIMTESAYRDEQDRHENPEPTE